MFYLIFICITLFLVLDCSKITVSQSVVRSLPGFNGPLPFELETGYESVDDLDDVQLFYYIKSERNPSKDPLLLWISGGPGCTSFSALVLEIGNEAEYKPLINLKGYLLGNPVTDVDVDHNYDVPFSHGMGLISDELYKSAKESCKEVYVNIDPSNAQCNSDLEAVSQCISRLNDEHILEPKCLKTAPKPKQMIRRALDENSTKIVVSPPPVPALVCRSYAQMLSYYWANDERVQRALNIREGTKDEWIRCNQDGLHYTKDIKTSLPYHRILSRRNYPSLIISGDHDLVVPYLGTQAWIRSLQYPIVDDWRPWFVDTQVAGYTRTYANNMTFATVKGGGHAAATYLPKQCLAMFTRWISHDPL